MNETNSQELSAPQESAPQDSAQPKDTRETLSLSVRLAIAAGYFGVLIIPQLIGGYGIFRDELYYLACAHHYAFGYVDQPPLSIWLLGAVINTFGDSLIVIRLAAAFIGTGVIYATWQIARELGGGKWAQFFAMLATASAPGLMTMYGFYSMNVLDHYLWTTVVLHVLRLVNSGDTKLWPTVGFGVGLGLLNKYSMIFLVIGLSVGMLLTGHWRLIRTRKFLYAIGMALLVFSPNLIWEIVYGWPSLEFIHNAQAFKMAAVPPIQFLIENILSMGPIMLLVWGTGLLYLLLAPSMRPYRFIAVSYLVILIMLMAQTSKPYYLFAAYPPLFAAGAVAIQRLSEIRQTQWYKYLAAAIGVGALAFAIPLSTPLLKPKQFVDFAKSVGVKFTSGENDEIGALPQHFADRFGWREMAAKVSQVYYSLTPDERKRAIIYGSNYGEAGAIDYFGREFGLPHAYSGHNNYWYWGPPKEEPEIVITIGEDRDDLETLFDSVELGATTNCDYCRPSENNQSIFICRGLKQSLISLWPQVREFI